MGNFKFKLSDMMPNAWFYKLRDMSKTKNHPSKKNLSKFQRPTVFGQNQAYFYYAIETNNHYSNSTRNPKIKGTQFPEPSRKSSKKTRRKAIYRPSPRHSSSTSHSAFVGPDQIHARNHSDCSTEGSTELDFVKSSSSEFESEFMEGFNGLTSWSNSCNCRISSSTADFVIDMNENSSRMKFEKFDDLSEFSELDLPRIQTRLPNSNDTTEFAALRYNKSYSSEFEKNMKIMNLHSMKMKKEKTHSPVLPRKSTGVKLGTKSPKLVRRKIQNKSRKSVPLEKRPRTQKKTFSQSFAVVKASLDPEKDFRDSMKEMIVENNIRTSKELEDLLACFLSLNSDEYQGVIVKAFEEIWFSMSEMHL